MLATTDEAARTICCANSVSALRITATGPRASATTCKATSSATNV
jgi:hypothetical protein